MAAIQVHKEMQILFYGLAFYDMPYRVLSFFNILPKQAHILINI